jgi:ABC-type sugar transport system ATPase subunit
MRIEARGLVVRRGRFVLGPLGLSVPSGEYLVVMGPNASGKTTLLYALAGFLEPIAGLIEFDGRDMADVPPESRDLGFVFAEPALFPTMTVAENVGFAQRFRTSARDRFSEPIELLGIADLTDECPGRLSTGQSRRVEIARALASGPRVLLLDEPYAAIPPGERASLASRIKEFCRRDGTTVVHVTHLAEDQGLGDRTVVLEGGRLSSPASE